MQKLQTDTSTDESDYSGNERNKGDLGYIRIDAKSFGTILNKRKEKKSGWKSKHDHFYY